MARRHEVELNPLEREFLDASIVLKHRGSAKENKGTRTRSCSKARGSGTKDGGETRKLASRANVSLARYLKKRQERSSLGLSCTGATAEPENREASELTAAMLAQLSWPVPFTDSMRHDAGVRSAQFNPEGKRVVTASDDKTARLWNAANGGTDRRGDETWKRPFIQRNSVRMVNE